MFMKEVIEIEGRIRITRIFDTDYDLPSEALAEEGEPPSPVELENRQLRLPQLQIINIDMEGE